MFIETLKHPPSLRNPLRDTDAADVTARRVVAINAIIRNNFKLLLLAVFMGAAIGAVFYLAVPKRYSSRMIIQSSILTEVYATNITENLEQLVFEKNSSEISKKLYLTKKEASNIISIRIENMRGKKGIPKEEDLLNVFLVTVQVFDNTVLPKLQKGILSLLSNSEYVKIKEKQTLLNSKRMIEKIDNELASIDSMKETLFARKPKSFDVFLMDPTTIYKVAVELSKEKMNYERQLELIDNVQLVEGFTTYNKPSFPALPTSMMGGALIGIGILLMTLCYKGLLKVGKSFYPKNPRTSELYF